MEGGWSNGVRMDETGEGTRGQVTQDMIKDHTSHFQAVLSVGIKISENEILLTGIKQSRT